MTLLDDIRAEGKQKGPRCTICRLRDTLPTEDASDLDEAMLDNRYSGTQIGRALAKRYPDTQVTALAVNRHRRGDCRYGKDH